ncbi:MAG: amidohydrolase family protein [Verrucomicrobiae bacterium]|nr:amidohydrolase family protein [Verrucomicrobiae bacterium]
MNATTELHALRKAYHSIQQALPWFDATVRENDPPFFKAHAHPLSTPHAQSLPLDPKYAGRLASLRKEKSVQILRYDPTISGPIQSLEPFFAEMTGEKMPLAILHTDLPFSEMGPLAVRHPGLNIIMESGPRKILYSIVEIETLLLEHPNMHLSTWNFVNWLGIERFLDKGLGQRLLFGSHWPEHNPDVAMGPIIFGQFSWRTKCELAGNNLRRLLQQDPVHPPEVPFHPPQPFIIDSHCHNVELDAPSPNGFPTPDEHMAARDWTAFMDHTAIEQIFLISAGSLFHSDTKTCGEGTRELRQHSPGRFLYWETFHPSGGPKQRERLLQSLKDGKCVGVKIHPSLHRVAADDPSYAAVFEITHSFGKPILSHTWEKSSYNPVQHLSHPVRFEKHLKQYPETRLILGHAGGRPSAFDDTVKICRSYPNVMADISGDYFDNGLIEALVAEAGVERILFGSDMDWIDPRCNLGAVLGAKISDQQAHQILRGNAERFFKL